MRKHIAILALLVLATATASAADFGDLLARLDSRDFSAEIDTLTGVGGAYVGETANPHSETVMFKARDEYRALMSEARDSAEKTAELNSFAVDALNSEVSVETKVWILQQLAVTASENEVPALEALLKGDEQRLIDASAAALAKIPGDAAQAVLESNAEAIPAAASALLSRTAAIPAMNPNETEMPLALANAPQEAVDEWLAGYDSFDEEMKAKTLASLTARDDKTYRPYALAALNSDSEILKRAGFLALEKMATAEDADIFLNALATDHDLAIRLASFVAADGFDDALKAALNQAADSARFLDIETILVNRAVDIRAEVFVRTTAKECENRWGLLQPIAAIVTPEDTPSLVASTLLIPRGADHDAAENLIAGVLNGNAEPLIKLLGTYPPAAIYQMICRTGGDAAKAELAKGLESKNQKLRQAAMSALPTWADAQFADTMMGLIEGGKLSEAQTIPLLRAYIRVISLPDDKIGITMSRDEKLDNLKKAFALSKRVDEKKLILSRLAANRTEKSLAFAVECSEDPELLEAACEAIADHAHDTAIRKQFADQVAAAIDIVINKSQNAELIERVKVYKGRME